MAGTRQPDSRSGFSSEDGVVEPENPGALMGIGRSHDANIGARGQSMASEAGGLYMRTCHLRSTDDVQGSTPEALAALSLAPAALSSVRRKDERNAKEKESTKSG